MDPWDDPYEILDVEEGAEVDEIKEAYRQRAEETHPEAEGGGEEEYSRVQEAYERLMEMNTPVEDAERRHEPGMQQEKHTLVDELRLGWEMYRTPDWEFYIVREAREPEDAAEEETGSADPRMKEEVGELEEKPAEPPEPKTEDDGEDEEGEVDVEYVDGQGSAVEQTYYFDDSDEARKAFARHLKHRKIERESESEDEIEAEDRGWGSLILGRKLGRRWTLTHQEREPLGERTRWAVYSEGNDSYIDEEGGESESEEWFETEQGAVDAHERYVGERAVPDALSGYLVFLLVYLVFLLPYHLVLGVVGAVYKVNGGGRDDDRYVAEAIVVVTLALLSFFVSPWIAGYLLLQVAVVAVYWASSYDVEALNPVPPLSRS